MNEEESDVIEECNIENINFQEQVNANGQVNRNFLQDENVQNLEEEEITYSSSEEEDSDYDEADEEVFNVPDELFQLRDWAINRKICQSHLDELLGILRQRLLPTLPKSSKTCLDSNKAIYNIIEMQNSHGGVGKFVYYGIVEGIEKCVKPELHPTNIIELIVNVDGLPITKSGTEEFWPISGNIFFHGDVYKPFPIAVNHGESKPGSLE